MNERTIQLYKQAVDFAYTTAGEDAGKGTVVEGLTAGKFAELIVRECADVCYEHSFHAGGVDTAFGYGYKDCGDDIKRTFGVEE